MQTIGYSSVKTEGLLKTSLGYLICNNCTSRPLHCLGMSIKSRVSSWKPREYDLMSPIYGCLKDIDVMVSYIYRRPDMNKISHCRKLCRDWRKAKY